MLSIIQAITKKKCYVGENNPEFVVIHETDNWNPGASDEAHAQAMQAGNLAATVHYYVDSDSIHQTLEHQDGAWAVGDGKGKYGITNRNSINVEICVNPESDYYKAVDNAEQLAAYLLNMYGWGTDRLKRHYDASRKHCPRRILDEGLWDEFVQKTSQYMAGENPGVTAPSRVLGNGDRGEDVRELQEKLIYLEYDCGGYGADGAFGGSTEAAVKSFQGDYGLSVDGLAGPKTMAALNDAVAEKQAQTGGKNYVQAGAFSSRENADNRVASLKAAGFDAFVKEANGMYCVQAGAFDDRANADDLVRRLLAAGFEAIVKVA